MWAEPLRPAILALFEAACHLGRPPRVRRRSPLWYPRPLPWTAACLECGRAREWRVGCRAPILCACRRAGPARARAGRATGGHDEA
jgi:hypothetical protein